MAAREISPARAIPKQDLAALLPGMRADQALNSNFFKVSSGASPAGARRGRRWRRCPRRRKSSTGTEAATTARPENSGCNWPTGRRWRMTGAPAHVGGKMSRYRPRAGPGGECAHIEDGAADDESETRAAGG